MPLACVNARQADIARNFWRMPPLGGLLDGGSGELGIITATLVGNRQDFIRFLNQRKALRVAKPVLGSVGMKLPRKGAMGQANLVGRCRAGDAEDDVIVTQAHMLFRGRDGSHRMRPEVSATDRLNMADNIQQFAREAIEAEAVAVAAIVIDDQFPRAVRLILQCKGSVLTSGIGKAGHVARKLSASFSSTGTPSHFLSPADALHGDLGSVRRGDVIVLLSSSGESDEILRMLSVLKKVGVPVIAITSTTDNSLGAFLPTSCSGWERLPRRARLGWLPARQRPP